ncbi:hypothetical protein TNCV_1133401 [Trichonephila clavipes]|nr:hypothetical protein TNCV_1133401 [Trichonephila clavipes]
MSFHNFCLRGKQRPSSEMTPRQEFKDPLSKTRPSPGHSCIGSISAKQISSWRASPTTESNKEGSAPVIWQKQARRLPRVHPDYSATASERESNG